MKGIDISVHNGEVNVKQVRDAGYEAIIARAGYGKNNIDQRFERNAAALRNLDVLSGIYWFSYALSEAMAAYEADCAINAAKKYWVKCPIAYDLEYDSVRYARTNGIIIDKKAATDFAISFLKKVENAGYIPVLYTNRDYARNYFDIDRIRAAVNNLYIWYARYTSQLSDQEQEMTDIWQKSSTWHVPGVTGKVDLNEFYTDLMGESDPVEPKPVMNVNILNFQRAANADGYVDADGQPLTEDGMDGPKTRYVRKQVVLKAKQTEEIFVVGSTGALVEWFQERLSELGFETLIDGKFGKDSRRQTINMQDKYNLKVDGKAGYNTLSTAFYV